MSDDAKKKSTAAVRSATQRRAANVSLKQLRAFAAVAREGSFTRAAQQLFLSQSALSSLIRGLETELGLRLLDRTTRRLELTEAGAELVPTVERLLADIERVATDLRDVAERRRGRVRLGSTPLLAASLLPPLIAAFGEAWPGVEVQLTDAPADQLLAALRQGELDLALATFDQAEPDIEARPLLSDSMVAVVARHHPLAQRRALAWRELAGQPLLLLKPGSGLRALVERQLAAVGVEPLCAQQVTHITTAMALAAAGLGLALLPAYALQVGQAGDVVGLPLQEPTLTREVWLVHLKQRSLSPAARAMAEHLQQRLQQPPQQPRAPAPRRTKAQAKTAATRRHGKSPG